MATDFDQKVDLVATAQECIASGDISPEQGAKINKALERRGEADYRAYLLMRRMMPYLGVGPDGDDDFREAVQELQDEYEEIVQEREQANDEFVNTLLGRR